MVSLICDLLSIYSAFAGSYKYFLAEQLWFKSFSVLEILFDSTVACVPSILARAASIAAAVWRRRRAAALRRCPRAGAAGAGCGAGTERPGDMQGAAEPCAHRTVELWCQSRLGASCLETKIRRKFVKKQEGTSPQASYICSLQSYFRF